MGRGRPPWEPLTAEDAVKMIASLNEALDSMSKCLHEMNDRKIDSVPMHVTPMEGHLDYVKGFCVGAAAKVVRADLERQLKNATNEEKNQKAYRVRKAKESPAKKPRKKSI